jgi:hypothetical protein
MSTKTKKSETPKKRKSEDKEESQKKKKKLNNDEEKVESEKDEEKTEKKKEEEDVVEEGDELENSPNKVNSELENFEKKLSKAELPSVNEEAKNKQNIFWKNSSLLSDILKDNYEKEGKLEFFKEAQNILKNNSSSLLNLLTNLRDWKKLTKEQKKKYPVGSINLLDEACGSENLVEWNELSKEEKMLKVNDFISFCAENKSKVTQKFGDEGFIFQYQKRTIPEEVKPYFKTISLSF